MIIGTTLHILSNVNTAEESEVATLNLPVLDNTFEAVEKLQTGKYELTPAADYTPDITVVRINGREFILHPKTTQTTQTAQTVPTTPPVQNGRPQVRQSRQRRSGFSRTSPTTPQVVRPVCTNNPYAARSYKAYLLDEVAARQSMNVDECIDWFDQNGWRRPGEDDSRMRSRIHLKFSELLKDGEITSDGAGTFYFISDEPTDETPTAKQPIVTPVDGLNFEFTPE